MLRRAHPPPRVFVGHDRRTGGMERRVVVRMIEVPVRIDHDLHPRPETLQCGLELGPGGRNKRIDHDQAARVAQHHDVAAGTRQHGQILAEALRLDRHGAELRPKRREAIRLLGQDPAWDQCVGHGTSAQCRHRLQALASRAAHDFLARFTS